MNNWRWTRQRHKVMEAVQGRTDHPTAEELYRSLRDRGDKISLATVYRTLHSLAKEGLIRELHWEGPDRFDPNISPHYHFRCRRCGQIYDVEVPYQDELDHLPLPPGFRVHRHELTFVGLCPECEETAPF
jgi:Fur family peroxide stress response transcriptional regulator